VKLFNFINLAKHPELACNDVNLITDMPREDLERLPDHFNRVFNLIGKNRGSYICDSLLERLTEKLEEPSSAETRARERHYSAQRPGMTRDCIDPWSYAKVSASSAVVPCCRAPEALGFLSEGRTLDEMLNNQEMTEFRRTLLTGKLRNICLTCNIRGWTTIERLRFNVAMFQRFGTFLPFFHRNGVLLPLVQRLRREQPRSLP
jgi:hypothetical protein